MQENGGLGTTAEGATERLAWTRLVKNLDGRSQNLLPLTTITFPARCRLQFVMETSRIFVRGLPPKFSEEDVRKHFAKFPVTDVKYFPARRIGYIGYKTPEDASKAVKYFNKSFIRMSKIFAEPARPVSLQTAIQ